MPDLEKIDIAILIPKADELKAFEIAFNIELGNCSGTLARGTLYYLLDFSIIFKNEDSIILK